MNKLICLAIASILIATTPTFAKVIESKKELLSVIVGKKMTRRANSKDWVLISKNGKFEGVFNGTAYSGRWSWRGGYWCRKGKIGKNKIPYDCQIFDVTGSTLKLTRDKGKGLIDFYIIR